MKNRSTALIKNLCFALAVSVFPVPGMVICGQNQQAAVHNTQRQ